MTDSNTSKKMCRVPGCGSVGKPQGGGKRASLCRFHYKNSAKAVKKTNKKDDTN